MTKSGNSIKNQENLENDIKIKNYRPQYRENEEKLRKLDRKNE